MKQEIIIKTIVESDSTGKDEGLMLHALQRQAAEEYKKSLCPTDQSKGKDHK